jgi:tetratricopeptide (TPR) repeat protein
MGAPPTAKGAALRFSVPQFSATSSRRGRALRAIDEEPSNAEARFNRANVFHDRHEYQAALILYRDAVALAPDFADACFNLALTCKELELVEEARRHWRRYLDLDPMGNWAAIAREHLDGVTR